MVVNDDAGLTSSHSEYFGSRESRDTKAREIKLRELGKEIAAKPLSKDKTVLKLKILERQLDAKKDEQTKRQRLREDLKRSKQLFGPKSHVDKAELERLKADTRPRTDQLVEQAEQVKHTQQDQQKSGEIQQNPS